MSDHPFIHVTRFIGRLQRTFVSLQDGAPRYDSVTDFAMHMYPKDRSAEQEIEMAETVSRRSHQRSWISCL
jgi:hypothetical protein